MDIRNYFSNSAKKSAEKKKSSKRPIVFESDDEDPIPTKIRKKPSKIVALASDSDSDIEVTNKSKSQSKIIKTHSKVKKTPDKKSPLKSKVKKTPDKKSPVKTKRKSVSVDDFFGSSPVKQTFKSSKSSDSNKSDKKVPNRTELHDDEDFNKTLDQLDEKKSVKVEKKAKLEKKANGESAAKSQKAEDQSKGLASKLSEKVQKANKANGQKVKEKVVSEMPTTPKDKQKMPEEQKTPVDSEQKKKNFMNYQKYLHRDGPKAPGSKVIPEGGENCLEGLTFVISGVLESLERDEAKSLVERYGGKVTTNVSKNTSYLLAGDDAGPSKLEKASKLGTKQIDEDGLLDLIKTLPGKRSKFEVDVKEEMDKKLKKVKKTKTEQEPTSSKKEKKVNSSKTLTNVKQESVCDGASESRTKAVSNLWVDKYRPTNIKDIIGQHGEKSNANKLLSWLRSWHKNRAGSKGKPNFAMKWKDETGASYKAALLSGSPGIGKTTTAQVVCKTAGFSYIEMNASDTRSKKHMEEHIASLVSNKAINQLFDEKKANNEDKHVLIMDEVDGMAGNEDRGGVQELIHLIKSTKIPIICICNDKSLPKMRSLLNYCFDLPFHRPNVQQIKGAIMSVAFKEGVKIAPPALQELIMASNQDIRQVLHNLSVWSANDKSICYDQAKDEASKIHKNVHMSPFEVLRKVFSGGEGIKTVGHKSDLFFHDYSLAPLFVQENYLNVNPRKARGDKKKLLQLISATATSISDGDLIERRIRSSNNWSLLPVQAMFSSVIPGEYMNGSLSGMINFPSWLGKNSSRNKMDRLSQQLQQHTRLHISANKTELLLDYCKQLKNAVVDPLVNREADGVTDSVAVMEAYSLAREDLDALIEVTTWSNASNPFNSLNPKVKAAFTRTYNKEAIKKPYSNSAPVAKKSKGSVGMNEFEEEDIQDDGSDDEKVDNDAMIKVKAAAKPSASKASSSGAKSKSKGKAKK